MGEERHKTFTKKRVAFCLAAVVLFSAVIGLLMANHDSTLMPVYQGKTAREWMDERNGMRTERQNEAFRHMGSNAVPFLVHELARGDSHWEKFCFWIYAKLPQGIRRHLSSPLNATKRETLAGDYLIKANSRTAVPSLLRVLAEGDEIQQYCALVVLEDLVKPEDTNWIPQLTMCLKSKESCNRLLGASILVKLDSGELAIPTLTNLLVTETIFYPLEASKLLERIDPQNATKWREMLPHGESSQGSQQAIAPK